MVIILSRIGHILGCSGYLVPPRKGYFSFQFWNTARDILNFIILKNKFNGNSSSSSLHGTHARLFRILDSSFKNDVHTSWGNGIDIFLGEPDIQNKTECIPCDSELIGSFRKMMKFEESHFKDDCSLKESTDNNFKCAHCKGKHNYIFWEWGKKKLNARPSRQQKNLNRSIAPPTSYSSNKTYPGQIHTQQQMTSFASVVRGGTTRNYCTSI